MSSIPTKLVVHKGMYVDVFMKEAINKLICATNNYHCVWHIQDPINTFGGKQEQPINRLSCCITWYDRCIFESSCSRSYFLQKYREQTQHNRDYLLCERLWCRDNLGFRLEDLKEPIPRKGQRVAVDAEIEETMYKVHETEEEQKEEAAQSRSFVIILWIARPEIKRKLEVENLHTLAAWTMEKNH